MTLRIVPGIIREPPNGFTYIHAEDGHITQHRLREACLEEAKRYRQINHYPVPQDFELQFDNQVCHKLPPGWCVDTATGLPPAEMPADPMPLPISRPRRKAITAKEIWQGTQFFIDYFASGGAQAGDDEIAKRVSICTGCEFNIEFDHSEASWCSSCSATAWIHKAANWLMGIRQTAPVPNEDKLRACYHCGCSNRAQVRAPLELLQKHTNDTVNTNLPSFCWKKRKA